MNFDLSQEQQLLADTLKRFITNDYTFDARSKIVASNEGYQRTPSGRRSPRSACSACRSRRTSAASAAARSI